METLFIAVAFIAAFFVVVYVVTVANENTERKTGMDLGEWLTFVFMEVIFGGIVLAGLGLVGWAMKNEYVVVAIVGLVVVGVGLVFLIGNVLEIRDRRRR